MKDLAFILRVLTLTSFADDMEEVVWRTDGEYGPVSFFVNCNDLFFWGCADLEEVTPANVDELERAIADTKAIDPDLGTCSAYELFCARVRKMRPQGTCYRTIPVALWPLFDACGPDRPVDHGNSPRPTVESIHAAMKGVGL